MKQTIEIEVPDGKKAVWRQGNVVFEDIKPQLPKTWREFCEKNEIGATEACINNNSMILLCAKRKPRDYRFDENVLPNRSAAETHLALMKLHQLRDCYRQGWQPDWTTQEDKYIIENAPFKLSKYRVSFSFFNPGFLSFQNERLALEFLNNFRDLIEQAGDLI